MDEEGNYNYIAKSITIEEFPKICRTCFSEININPIIGSRIGDMKVVELLDKCVSLEVNEHDPLPPNICSQCMDELLRIYEFKKQCHDSDCLLKLLLQNVEDKPPECKETEKATDSRETFCDITFEIEFSGDGENKRCSDDDVTEIDPEEHETEEVNNVTKESRTHSTSKRKKRNSYTCKSCQKQCSSSKELRDHQKEAMHSAVKATRLCEYCNKWIRSNKINQHVRSHTKEKPYKCNMCPLQFSVCGNLKRHLMRHTGERPYVCDLCGKGFIQSTSLHIHKKTHMDYLKSRDNSGHSSDLNFTCHHCGRKFKRKVPFNQHLQRHNKTDLDVKQSVREPTSQIEQENLSNVCAVCHKTFKSKYLLKAHERRHGEKSYLCSDCGTGFFTKAALLSHVKVHTGEKPYTCITCEKSFAHVGSLETHMLIHSGQRPHKCKFCWKSFTQMSHLKYHLRTHSGERPYCCSYCGKTFALNGNLTVHVRTHTGETPYLCTICGKGFYDSSSMTKHRKNHRKGDEVKTVPSKRESKVPTPEVYDHKEDLSKVASRQPLCQNPEMSESDLQFDAKEEVRPHYQKTTGLSVEQYQIPLVNSVKSC